MKFFRSHIGRWYEGGFVPYMRRWILSTRLGDVHLHCIHHSDTQHLHTHPFKRFISIRLNAPYVEEFQDGSRVLPRFVPVLHDGAGPHRVHVSRPTWTLVFTSPAIHPWGFQTPSGYVPWQQYPDLMDTTGEKL